MHGLTWKRFARVMAALIAVAWTACALHAQLSGWDPGSQPDHRNPDPGSGHDGRIWVLPDGSEVHGGPGHTGVPDAPYHHHPRRPKGKPRGGKDSPKPELGEGTPLDGNGKPLPPKPKPKPKPEPPKPENPPQGGDNGSGGGKPDDKGKGSPGAKFEPPPDLPGIGPRPGPWRPPRPRPERGPGPYPPMPPQPGPNRGPWPRPGRPASTPGGIDFTSFRLTYISTEVEAGPSSFVHLFSARYLGGESDQQEVGIATRRALNAFLVGLAMPQEVFWVNLKPAEPNRIADEGLAKTGVARVLLEADFQMKKDGAHITDPRSSQTGKEYWRRLLKVAGSSGRRQELRQETRFWIVPGRIILSGDDNEAHLREATLEVKLESEHFERRGSSGRHSEHRRGAREAAENLSKELVLPRLTELVNTAPQYAELREVYASLILARWYKERFRGTSAPHANRLDTGDLSGLESGEAWNPQALWKTYVRSVKEGEYNFIDESRETRGNMTIVHRAHYFSGGVDFVRMELPPLQPLDSAERALFAEALSSSSGVLRENLIWFASLDLPPLRVGSTSDGTLAPESPAGAAPTQVRESARVLAGLGIVAGILLVVGALVQRMKLPRSGRTDSHDSVDDLL